MKLLVFLILNLFLQPDILTESDEYTLFSNNKNIYILKESVILKRTVNDWQVIPHNLELESYSFQSIVSQRSTYLISNGLGKVLEFKNDSIVEIDKSTFWNSKYESFSFIRKNQIYSYGGYGFYIYRNDMLYFDFVSKEWFKYKMNLKNIPPPATVNFGFYDEGTDILYIGLGINDSSNENKIFSYDFTNDIWSKIGETSINLLSYTKSNNYFDNLIIVGSDVYSINCPRGIIKMHKSTFPDIKSIDQIHFNKETKKFIITRKKSMSKQLDVQILDEVDIIGRNYKVLEFKKENEMEYLYFILIGFIFSLSLFMYTQLKVSKDISFIKKNIKSIKSEISEIDILFIDLLINQYPQPVKYMDFMDLLDKTLAYETKVKKVRESINRIDDVLKKKLNRKDKTLITSRNLDDNRIKEVKINLVAKA